MKTIAILLLETATSIGAVGAVEILAKTCTLWRQVNQSRSDSPLFDVQVVAEKRKPVSFANGITLRPSAAFGEVKPDLIVVPSLEEDIEPALLRNSAHVQWIKQRFKKGAHVSSLCTGAFVLGEAGILDGKRATTHWLFANEFRGRFPRVDLQERHMLVDEGDVVTCGGATTFLNLMIYLIEKYFGHDLAVHASKVFLIDMDRPSQLPFKIHAFAMTHGESAIARSQSFVAEHLGEELLIDDLARRVGMSVRNFSRRFKNATGESFSSYVQKSRLEKAKGLLESTDSSASEVMYRVGYKDERSFRRLFKRYTGLAPKFYRHKFRFRLHQTDVI